MEPIPYAELSARPQAYDGAVAATPAIDRFCSSSCWILPAHEALERPREPWIRRSPRGWLALVRSVDERRGFVWLEPLEVFWGMACPLVGGEPAALVADVSEELDGARGTWDATVLTGLPPRSELFEQLLAALQERFEVRGAGVVSRYSASLQGGVDGFLSRRSASFRKKLRQARRRVAAAGIRFEPAPPGSAAQDLYRRVLDVERRSWKGHAGVGIHRGTMRRLYGAMVPRLQGEGALWLLFARRDGEDLAYVLGGVCGDTFRGLQFSYDQRVAGLSLGNVAQLETIRRLCDAGVRHYDLGMDVPYKRRWAERRVDTVTVVAYS